MRIVTRAEWGARPFRNGPPVVPLSWRRWFIVHYPGAGTPPRNVGDYAKWIERIHMDQNGWRGVGYNFFIGPDGAIAEGCGRDVRGSHSPPHNVDGFGVNIWTSNGVATPESMHAARQLYERLCDQTGRRLQIGWHGMDYPTECPGPQLRSWAKAGMPDPLAGTIVNPPAPAPVPEGGLFGMTKIATYRRRKHTARDGKWTTVKVDPEKGYVTLFIGPGNCLATVKVEADIPEGVTLQGRFYEVDFKSGQKTKRISDHLIGLELTHTSGNTYGGVTDLTYIGPGREGRSRRLRFEMIAYGADVEVSRIDFDVMGE